MELKSVKYAAIYLRKSRDEMEKGVEVLETHKKQLTEIAIRNGWDFDIYEEIGSGASVEYRDELKRLMADMDRGLFDVVLVMDTDRLSRSSGTDWEHIKNVFKRNAVFLQTPTATYDYNNVDNEFMGDLLAVFARFELMTIKKRFRRAKITKSGQGYWTNGTPPIGYKYDKTTKRLVIDEEKAPIVQYIKEQALLGVPFLALSFDLNKKAIPSPRRGVHWSPTAIHRMMTNKVYTGRVVFGKSSGSGHKNRPVQELKYNAKSDWIVSEIVHPVLITDEEFYTIADIIASRTLVPHRGRAGVFPLSTLVRCGKCGRVHSFYEKKKYNNAVIMKPCQRYSKIGEKCTNGGISVGVLYQIVDDRLQAHIKTLKANNHVESGRYNELQIELKAKFDLIDDVDERFERLNDLYIEGRIRSKAQYDKQHEALTKQLADTKKEIIELEKALERYQGRNPEERLRRIIEFQEIFHNPNVAAEEKNRLAKQIISKIEYNRNGDEVDVNIVIM